MRAVLGFVRLGLGLLGDVGIEGGLFTLTLDLGAGAGAGVGWPPPLESLS